MNRKRIVLAVVGLLIVAAVVYLAVFRNRASAAEPAASGTVEATEADLGFQLPGRIATVGPHEGDRVKAGDTLAMLDRTDLAARRSQARAAVAAARAGLLELERGARSEELAQPRRAWPTRSATSTARNGCSRVGRCLANPSTRRASRSTWRGAPRRRRTNS